MTSRNQCVIAHQWRVREYERVWFVLFVAHPELQVAPVFLNSRCMVLKLLQFILKFLIGLLRLGSTAILRVLRDKNQWWVKWKKIIKCISCICFYWSSFGSMHEYTLTYSGWVFSCRLPIWSSQTWRLFVRLPHSAPCSAYCSHPAERGSSPPAEQLSLLTPACSRGTERPLTSFVFLIGDLEFLHLVLWRKMA